jgi:hypothetical protein
MVGPEGPTIFLDIRSMKEIKTMYNKLTLLVLFAIVTLSAYAQKNAALNSLWRDSNIVINGDASDWDQPFRYYDSKSKFQYCVVNDASNMYICFKTMDDKTEMKMLRAGTEVWIDTTGKKKETTVIRFPLSNDSRLEWIQDPEEPERQQLERPDIKKMKLDYSTSDKVMKLTGFKDIPATKMPVENKYGIQLAIGWDKNDFLTYELKIPFSTFYKESISASDTLHPISIGIKVGGFDVPQQISNGSVTDPSTSNSGMRNQGYGTPGGGSSQQTPGGGSSQGGQQPMTMAKVSDMAMSVDLLVRMKMAYK